jgi:hypothetical protein
LPPPKNEPTAKSQKTRGQNSRHEQPGHGGMP